MKRAEVVSFENLAVVRLLSEYDPVFSLMPQNNWCGLDKVRYSLVMDFSKIQMVSANLKLVHLERRKYNGKYLSVCLWLRQMCFFSPASSFIQWWCHDTWKANWSITCVLYRVYYQGHRVCGVCMKVSISVHQHEACDPECNWGIWPTSISKKNRCFLAYSGTEMIRREIRGQM